jgi:hypothetical protein
MNKLTRTEETLLRFYVGCHDGTISPTAPWPLRQQHTPRAAAGLARKGYVIETPGKPRVITDEARAVLAALDGTK